jgi:tetratricopeptide (TPR) repeat protein
MTRHFPKIVSLLGSLGLGMAGAYLFGVVLLFVPGFQPWVDFFIVWGPLLVTIPGGLLIGHLYLRTHLGGWLLDQERVEEAITYTEERLEPGVMRGRRETLYHRIYLARAHICRERYEEALELLSKGYARPSEGSEALKIGRWMLEAALRLEWGEAVDAAVEGLEMTGGGSAERAAVEACLAEWAALEADREAYHTHLDEGRWADRTEDRLDVSEALGLAVFARLAEDRERALERLNQLEAPALRAIPGRAGEWRARRGRLLIELGRTEEAREVLTEDGPEGDERSQRIITEVRQRLTES